MFTKSLFFSLTLQLAHVALIDALMLYHATSTLSVNKVIAAVRKFAKFSASSELPTTLDDRALFWVNKACGALCQRLLEGEEKWLESPPPPRPKGLALDEMRGVSDGRCLAALIAFYRPDILRTTGEL